VTGIDGESGAGAQLQRAHFAAWHATQRSQRTTPSSNHWCVNYQRKNCAQTSQATLLLTVQQPQNGVNNRLHQQAHDNERQLRQRRTRHDRAHSIALGAHIGADQHCSRSECTTMSHHRSRIHHHSRTEHVESPTHIPFFAKKRNLRGETTDLTEDVVAHQHASRRQSEGIAHGVVLLLVAFARVDDVN
jgi:hypothetical protein